MALEMVFEGRYCNARLNPLLLKIAGGLGGPSAVIPFLYYLFMANVVIRGRLVFPCAALTLSVIGSLDRAR